MAKPTINCILAYPVEYLKVGGFAFVEPQDHPNHLPDHHISNKSAIRTSIIVAVNPDTSTFETMNSIYKFKEV